MREAVARGADLEWTDAEGWSALLRAADSSHESRDEIVLELVSHGASLDVVALDGTSIDTMCVGDERLTAIVLDARVRRVRDWISHDEGEAPVFAHGVTPLMIAVRSLDLDLVEQVLERGHDLAARDARKRTALDYAIDEASVAVVTPLVRRLLDAGVPVVVRLDGTSVIDRAARRCRAELMQVLLEAIDDRQERASAASRAVHRVGHGDRAATREVIQVLKAAGADVNSVRSRTNATPLHTAVKEANVNLVSVLIAEGADTELRMRDPRLGAVTPLEMANADLKSFAKIGGPRAESLRAIVELLAPAH